MRFGVLLCFLMFTVTVKSQNCLTATQTVNVFLEAVGDQNLKEAHSFVDEKFWGDYKWFSSSQKGWGGINELDIYVIEKYDFTDSENEDSIIYVKYFANDTVNNNCGMYYMDFYLKFLDEQKCWQILKSKHASNHIEYAYELTEQNFNPALLANYLVNDSIDNCVEEVAFCYIPQVTSKQELNFNKKIIELIGLNISELYAKPLFPHNLKTMIKNQFCTNEIFEEENTYTHINTLELSFKDKVGNVVTVTDYGYMYSGGAHGLYGEVHHLFDVSNNKDWTFEEIVDLNYEAEIIEIIEKYARKQYEIEDTNPLSTFFFDDELTLPSDVYFEDKEAIFSYQVYEVAAYAYGIIKIRVPVFEIKNYLTPNFVKAYKL